MQAKKEILTGLQVALGVLLGSSLIVPALGWTSFISGLMTGLLAALLMLVWYCLAALRAPETGDPSRG